VCIVLKWKEQKPFSGYHQNTSRARYNRIIYDTTSCVEQLLFGKRRDYCQQVPVMMTVQMKQKLKELGYHLKEIKGFTPEEAWDIIENQIKPEVKFKPITQSENSQELCNKDQTQESTHQPPQSPN